MNGAKYIKGAENDWKFDYAKGLMRAPFSLFIIATLQVYDPRDGRFNFLL